MVATNNGPGHNWLLEVSDVGRSPMARRGGSIGRTSKAKAKPKVTPTRAPNRPSARASAPSRAQASRAAPGAKRSVKRKAEEANLGADHWHDFDENCESEATEESWDPTGCEAEDVSDAESEEMADPSRSRHGPSEADRVYAELIRNGATPAIVGKQRKVGKEQPEMELFTPAAAVKAGLISDPAEGRRHRQSFGFPFGNLFRF